MIKRLFLVCALLALVAVCLCACGEVKQPDTTEAPAVTTAPIGTPDCAHQFVEVSYVEPLALKDGEKKFECSACGGTYVEVIPMTRSVKILAIGNSFTANATAYLWSICHEAGIDEVIIGRATKTSSSINTHTEYIKNDTHNYTYTKYTSNKSVEVKEVNLDHCLLDEDWDIITLQQRSKDSGIPSSYGNLDFVISYVKEKCPDSDIYWHMTWACHEDSQSESFQPYDYDQMKMYTKISTTVHFEIEKKADIVGIIPAGTVFQNVRSSSIGDKLTADDGLHANSLGYYILGLTWYSKLTGGAVDQAYGCPSSLKNEMSTKFVIIKEAIENAFVTPYKVTESQYK